MSIVRTLQWRNADDPSPGAPFLRPDWHPVVSSALSDFRLQWNGNQFVVTWPGEVGVGLCVKFDGYNILEKHTVFAISDKEPAHLVSFGGISGGPSFDSFGNVNGVVVAESVRRGLLFAVSIEQISWLIAASFKSSVSPKDAKDKKDGNLSISLDSSSFTTPGSVIQ